MPFVSIISQVSNSTNGVSGGKDGSFLLKTEDINWQSCSHWVLTAALISSDRCSKSQLENIEEEGIQESIWESGSLVEMILNPIMFVLASTLKQRSESVSRRIVIGIAGASGVIYGIKMLSLLQKKEFETHLILSNAGKKNIEIETKYKTDEIVAMASYSYDNKDVGASLASGSFLTEGMVVVPCTIKTLSGIANSYNDNLLVRAADVTLKEKRKLVLVVRETPLHVGHLRLMTMAANMGAHILPPIPSFYHQPKTIDDIIHQTIGKILDYLCIDHDLFSRWVQSGVGHSELVTQSSGISSNLIEADPRLFP